MKKYVSHVLAVAASAVLCAVALFLPMGEGALWQRPCLNVYSLFAAVFFVMNSIGWCVMVGGGAVVGRKPYTEERPAIEAQKRRATAVVLAFFELPLLTAVFFVEGGWKMAVCTTLFVGGSLILAGLVGEWSADRLRKTYAQTEQRELAQQRKKEEGYR